VVTEKPRIIFFDLETIPNMKEAMKVWPQLSNYPGLTLRATITTIICAGWKVLGEKQVHCINAWDYSRWDKNINDDYSIVRAITKILKEADAVVTHNGKRFDWKFLQTRLLYHGLSTLHNIDHIDTCQVAKTHLFAFNNRLGTIGEALVREKKMEHEGWELWVKVSNKDEKAMQKMEAYCKQDVLLLEKIYNKMIPLMSNIPNYNLFSSRVKKNCPSCGGSTLQRNGVRRTKTKIYQRYLCTECGSSSRTDAKDNSPRSI